MEIWNYAKNQNYLHTETMTDGSADIEKSTLY